jgi:hypothetical protein
MNSDQCEYRQILGHDRLFSITAWKSGMIHERQGCKFQTEDAWPVGALPCLVQDSVYPPHCGSHHRLVSFSQQ